MERLTLREGILDLFEFARLHSWCTQLEQKLDDWVEGLSDQERGQAHAMVSELVPTSGKEESVVSLILLSRLGTPLPALTDRLYSSLMGRLTHDDIRFLSLQILQAEYPINQNLTADMTVRNYMSYKRALFWALELEGLDSSLPADATLFYLVLLLGQQQLNEQNRAILYFLIHRIDAVVPPALQEGVDGYLESLKSVIEEIKSEGDHVLSGRLDLESEPTPLVVADKKAYERPDSFVSGSADDQPEYEESETVADPAGSIWNSRGISFTSDSKEKKSASADAKPNADSIKQKERSSRLSLKSRGADRTDTGGSSKPGKTAGESGEDKPDRGYFSDSAAKAGTGESGSVQEISRISEKRVTPGTPHEVEDSKQAAHAPRRERRKGEGKQADANPAPGSPFRFSAASSFRAVAEKLFRILFNRNPGQLRELFRRITGMEYEQEREKQRRRRTGDHETAGMLAKAREAEIPFQPEADVDTREPGTDDTPTRRKGLGGALPRKLTFGQLGAFLAIFFLLALLSLVLPAIARRTSREDAPPLSEVPSKPDLPDDGNDPGLASSQPPFAGESPAATDASNLTSASSNMLPPGNLTIEMSGANPAVELASGEHLWMIHEWIIRGQLSSESIDYPYPPGMYWQLFFLKVRQLNPSIDNWDELAPGTLIRLPDLSDWQPEAPAQPPSD